MTIQRTARPRGVALIAVLWLVAAMGLIITGIVQSVRSEIKTASFQRQALVNGATADAAILLALQNLNSREKEPDNTIQSVPIKYNGVNLTVIVQPLNGLIDINTAPLTLLVDMYRYAGGLNLQAAQAIAQLTLETRQLKSAKGIPYGFDAIEDLLRVNTMTYDLYANIKPLLTADLKDGTGRVNPMVAPLGVLQILTGGDTAKAVILMAQRNADPKAMDTSLLVPSHIDAASTRSLLLQVDMPLANGGVYNKSWFVYLDADPRSGLPWRVLNTQQSLAVIASAGQQSIPSQEPVQK